MSLLDTASLIVTPNGYKEGKLYSVIPSDGSGDLSVTRATTATRVNSQGLVELVPYNLVQYSETFASPWGALSGASVSANSAVSPNGQNTAATFSVTSTAFSGFIQTLGSSAQNISIYAKKGTLDYLWIVNESISAIGASYNLATGVVTYTASGHTATIESVGNGWYRCTISHPTNGWEYMQFGLSNASNSGSSPSGGNAYIWGAQAVEGSVAKDYQKTETRLNIPRLDYSNGTCPSILVEPQRTNLLTYSSSFDDASWTKSSTTITANTTISPSGVQDAETAVFGSNGQVYKPISSNAVNTFSTYVKKGTNRYFSIQLETNSVVYRAIYDLDTTSVTFTGTNTSASITDEGNGWFRVSVVNTTSDAIAYTTLQAASSGTSVSGGSGTFYIWGAQLEAGSYATSYIPTTSASVTRNADVISKTSISSLIGQTEGTFFLDMYYDGVSSNFVLMQTFQNASQFNVIQLYLNSFKRLAFEVGNDAAILSPNSLTAGRYKIAGAYKNNDFVLYLNGDLIGTDTSGAVIATDAITFNDYFALPSTYKQVMEINASALWKTRLTNTQLAQLTTI